MRLSIDDDLEFGRKIVLFDPFAFEAPKLEIRHPENIVKPATIILAQALFWNVFQYAVHAIGNDGRQE